MAALNTSLGWSLCGQQPAGRPGPGGERARLPGRGREGLLFIPLPGLAPTPATSSKCQRGGTGAASAKQRDKNRSDRPSELRAPHPALVQPGGLTTAKSEGLVLVCDRPQPGWVLRALDPKQNATSAAVWEHFGQEARDQRLSANKLGNLQ